MGVTTAHNQNPPCPAGVSAYSGGAYSQIINSGECLEVPGANYAAGQQLGTATCNAASECSWQLLLPMCGMDDVYCCLVADLLSVTLLCVVLSRTC